MFLFCPHASVFNHIFLPSPDFGNYRVNILGSFTFILFSFLPSVFEYTVLFLWFHETEAMDC